jgi:hypothetical protein
MLFSGSNGSRIHGGRRDVGSRRGCGSGPGCGRRAGASLLGLGRSRCYRFGCGGGLVGGSLVNGGGFFGSVVVGHGSVVRDRFAVCVKFSGRSLSDDGRLASSRFSDSLVNDGYLSGSLLDGGVIVGNRGVVGDGFTVCVRLNNGLLNNRRLGSRCRCGSLFDGGGFLDLCGLGGRGGCVAH